jgi:hypothetical protein
MKIGTLPEDPRAALDRLITERGEDYAHLSRLIGRNPAYIQQFVKRGSPRRLAEQDRTLLARYLDVDPRLLGAPAESGGAMQRGLRSVRRLDIGASAGGGALDGDDSEAMPMAFDERWLRRMGVQADSVAIIRVEGDSMTPTLSHGDEIMVDEGDGAPRLRDGIYVLRRDGVLLVKRLGLAARGTVRVISDNAAYPSEDVAREDLTIVGRVIWASRRVG